MSTSDQGQLHNYQGIKMYQAQDSCRQAMAEKRPSSVAIAFDRQKVAFSRLDDNVSRLMAILEPVLRPTSTKATGIANSPTPAAECKISEEASIFCGRIEHLADSVGELVSRVDL